MNNQKFKQLNNPSLDQTAARREAQRQWEANPCAADSVAGQEKESLQWFREARRVRYEDYAPWLLSTTGITQIRNQRVLEIGVGVGSDHYSLASGGNEMHALDLSREHLRLTGRHLELEGLTTHAKHGDMENMPYEDNSFDVVYSFGVLHHTDHMDRAVSEIHRILRPGGRAIIGVYHLNSVYFWVGLMLINGILRGWLFRYGWRRTLARIESGAGNDFIPQVHLLTRRSLKRLFVDFEQHRVVSRHVGFPSRIQKLLPRSLRLSAERFFSPLGWYLNIQAVKPSKN